MGGSGEGGGVNMGDGYEGARIGYGLGITSGG